MSASKAAGGASYRLGHWAEERPLPQPFAGHGAAAVGDAIFVFGGYHPETFLYGPADGSAARKATLPRWEFRAGCVAHSGKVYVIGGEDTRAHRWQPTAGVSSYDPKTNRWRTGPDLTKARDACAAVSFGDDIYVIGGRCTPDPGVAYSLDTVERWRPGKGDTWEPVAPLTHPRDGLGAAAVGGKVYAIGGLAGQSGRPSVRGGWLEVYDPKANVWTDGPSMPTPRDGFATVVAGTRIYTIGGRATEGDHSAAVEYYDVADGAWHRDRPLPVGLVTARAVVVGRRLVVLGGESVARNAEATVYAADLDVPPDGLWAWGFNGFAQLGDGTRVTRLRPIQVGGFSMAVAAACGREFTLALRDDGTVWAWGYNGSGQLGDGTMVEHHRPRRVKGLKQVVAIAAGRRRSVALQSDGTVWSWGHNTWGQLGDGTRRTSPTPVQAAGLNGVAAVAAGLNHTVALGHEGTLWAWGRNECGQIGDGTRTDRHRPVKVLCNVARIACGTRHTVALKADGTLVSWGANEYGQFGDGTTADFIAPVAARDLTGVVDLAAGDGHTLALKADGSVWASGLNNYGQLGDGTHKDRSTFVRVAALADVVAIAAGYYHSAAVTRDGSLWVWGNNSQGQLGDGTTTGRNTPLRVRRMGRVASVACGRWCTAAVAAGAAPASKPIPANRQVKFCPATRHWYELVEVAPKGTDWDNAKRAAERLRWNGAQGHLVTITSHAESRFVNEDILSMARSNQYWTGGFQPHGSPEPAENWQWITGEPWTYEHWMSGEPSNVSCGRDMPDESVVIIKKMYLVWNDRHPSYPANGYVVEYQRRAFPPGRSAD